MVIDVSQLIEGEGKLEKENASANRTDFGLPKKMWHACLLVEFGRTQYLLDLIR